MDATRQMPPSPFSRQRVRQRGLGLIEIILAIAIGFVVIVLAMRQFDAQSAQQNATETAQGIQALQVLANQVYANSLGYTQTPNPAPASTLPFYYPGTGTGGPANVLALYDAGSTWPVAFPIAMPTSGALTASNFGDLWNGNLVVGTGSTDGSTQDLLTISISQVPGDSCIQLLAALAPVQYATTVNGNLVPLSPPPDAQGNGYNQVKWSQAAPLCLNNNNTMVFSLLKPLNFFTLRNLTAQATISTSDAARVDPEYARIQAAIAQRNAAQAGL